MQPLPTLREVLSAIYDQPRDWLFLPSYEPWSLDSRCAVLCTSALGDDELPSLAAQQRLMCTLEVSSVQQIVRNATQQLGSPTAGQLLEAFIHYYDNDAFIDFAQTSAGRNGPA